MSEASTIKSSFIEQAESIVLEHIANEQFGVSELADMMNMSRSNLLRRVKKDTELSASQFIRQVRLKKGMELLSESSLTVSEVSYQVGFGSSSYFIKCFREHYGYPPGEVGKREQKIENASPGFVQRHLRKITIVAFGILVLLVALLVFFNDKTTTTEIQLEKSIAVLPFKNDSNDSTNLYFVNGLMESALGNLQKIEDLRVISRTSSEQYRNTSKGIPEIAEELNVSYIVEGSGQRVGDQVLLNIQLIEASSDRHIWAEQYNHELKDVFAIQNEVARKIAEAIEAIVTPAELEQIEKKPTDNLQAYDLYLKALGPYNSRTQEGLLEAISLFEEAINHDPEFDLAYAKIAISYYWLDIFLTQKQYTEQLNNYADKALLYDAKSAESLIAKALYYMQIGEYRLAVPHLEKALGYNPNSSDVVQVLSRLYSTYIPNTGKYLENALKGIKIDIAANDSVKRSFIYLELGNAFIQTGFVEEAERYINLSLQYDANNPFASYVKAFILYAKNGDLEQTKNLLIKELEKDTTRLDLLQEVAKLHYFQKDYPTAFAYYQKFVEVKETYGLNIFPQEDCKIGFVYEKMGKYEESARFFKAYSEYCERDESIYKSASTAVKFIHEGELDLAIEQLNLFSQKHNYQYWILLFMVSDPMIEPLKTHPAFENVMQKIEDGFWEDHEALKKSLREKRLLN